MALAAGQRLRIRPSLVDAEGVAIDEESLAPITRIFLTALRTYGAYVVDNASGFGFYAEDVHTAVLHLPLPDINGLAGRPPMAPWGQDQTGWQVVLERLNSDLERIPVAFGPWQDGQDPASATIEISNWEVVEPAPRSRVR